MQSESFPAYKLGRRRYTTEFKRQIVAEVGQGNRSVAEVVRIHGLNANLVHKWLAAVKVENQALKLRPVSIDNHDPRGAELPRPLALGRVTATLASPSGRKLEFKDMDAGSLTTLLQVVS